MTVPADMTKVMLLLLLHVWNNLSQARGSYVSMEKGKIWPHRIDTRLPIEKITQMITSARRTPVPNFVQIRPWAASRQVCQM